MNYALLYYRGIGSGLPFNDFRWAYQPDGTPNFGGATIISSMAQATQKDLRKIEASLFHGVAFVSWTPMPGRTRLNLFDLKGGLLQKSDYDATQGTANVRLESNRTGQQAKVLQAILNDKSRVFIFPAIAE